MRKSHRAPALAGALVLGLAASCAPRPARSPDLPSGAVRYGPDRDRGGPREREAAAKRKLLRRINADRATAGLSALEVDLLAASVGDAFCVEAAERNYTGHWDLAGRPPYLRWALAGGVDFHGQNAGSISRKGWNVTGEEVARLLLECHERMMAERPPDDGHRRAILDPSWTHVGIGVAFSGGEFRMTEEFVRRVAEWVEVPAGPLPAGGAATIRMKLPDGWTAGVLEVAFDPPSVPLTREEVERRTSYGLPKGFAVLYPALAPPMRYVDGGHGEFTVMHGRIEARIPLSRGAGSYYAVLYAGKGPVPPGGKLWPVVVARVEAR